MSTESIPNAGQLEPTPHVGERVHTSHEGGTCNTLQKDACHLLSCANEHIRRNPVPIVAGALALGAALGYLLVSGRHEAAARSTLADLPDQAGDFLSNTLATLRGNLKFW